ncbi:hypothetical protein QVD17_06144 [Tagetes erecta]|uniref:FAS1 domain-containing protein n=1 Tax=Tagetes erecta TaxID=13708 RepID=A0AAD8LGC9_TARER|nr:hypothetical protein QVD17_06144 [Tagetes erecta]
MAATSGITTIIIVPIIILLIAILNPVIVTSVRESELTVMFGVLRARGYHLFANAIATSDVHYDLKSDGNFTLLAPINSALFALDMIMPATNYVTALRYHVLPRRMSMIDLLNLPPSENSVPTLVPGRDIHVEQRRSVRSLITIGGVDIVVPGMFYGRDMAVHGLGGILEYRHHTRSSPANLSGNFTSPNRSSPPIYNITGNYTFQFPVAIQSPLSSHRTQNQTVLSPDPSSTTNGSDKHVHSSSNQTPIRSASVDFKAEEHKSRVKLLEVSSESTGMDDETLDCSLADSVGDEVNARIHPRRLDVASNMICGQKQGQASTW